ncbi:hypothetical protein Glove_173g63 [Diversispora epigaea]|uniref:Uncharacterized protein n=1 Tax=Diversispora epigaea TaxID=1348612 RepID=A0A397IXF2_9GLOM|nr:hypothetical protein Glove_173g63 [Diversispora epigaea]
MIRSSLNLMVLLISWITIFSLTSSISGFVIFTHNETNPFKTTPRIWQYGKYFDGTVVIRIINPNITSLDNSFWIRPVLSLRIIHPNGTVSEIDKDLKIPEFNWHITKIPDSDYQDPISIYALQKGYLLVTYFNASNPDDINTYEEWGRIIDWNGNLYDEVYFGGAYIENGTWYPTATKIVSNVDPEKGFIRIAGRNVDYVEWQQYMINDTFNLRKTLEDSITLPQNGSSTFNVVGYDDKEFSAPKMIYQLPLDNITISDLFCAISSTGIGQVCTFNVTHNDVYYYVKLNFLSSGSITEIIPLSLRSGENTINTFTSVPLHTNIKSIPYGGYVFYKYFLDETNHINVNQVNYFNEYTKNSQSENFDESNESLVLGVRGIMLILPNNTMLVSQMEDLNSWSFLTTEIPKFTDLKNEYSNFQVNSTRPSINTAILTSTKNITLTYHEPVELSNGNIWIYQIDNSGNDIIRQYLKGVNSFCSISENGLTVTVNVIKSTFSDPNSQFYIKVDNNFARSKTYRESLTGIYGNIWKFNTHTSEEIFADTVYGVMRLTAEGTEYYENLNSTEKDQFFIDLHIDLSKIIPVNIERLSSNGKTQVDNTISPSHQIFISLNIESSKEGRSVASIVIDLNDMIVYKNMTSVGLFPTTKYLDGDFGFKPKQNIWNKYMLKFSGVILVLAILVVLFLIAHSIDNKGRNIAVLQFGLIIFDFIMDVLFVSENSQVIKVLYIPSIVFLTVPIVFNTIWAFYVISDENKSKDFLNWFTRHEKVASLFTVLSSADIETLSILHSNIAGFEFFQAPISIKGKNRIFRASCLTIFVEDIPQVIIQILYQQSVVAYDIIPLFTLVSSCLSLLINIVGRLFQAINSCRPGTLDESISHSIDFKEENSNNKKSSVVSVVWEFFCM